MKTRFIFLFAAMALLAGCAKEEKAPMANENKEGVTVLQVGLPSNPTVSSSIDSKTHMGEADTQGKHKVYWSNGDKIRVNGEESVALSGLADDASSATFTINSVLDVPYKVLYPSSIYGSSIYYVNLPAVQEYKSGSFAEGALPMAGYSADGTNITMHHLCAIYKVQILRASTDPDEHDIVAVRFRGRNSEQVSGTFEISYDGHSLGASNGSGGDLEVKVVGRQATSTTTPAVYYIVVPARVYQQGFDVIIQDVQGHIMTKSLEGYQFPEAGHLYPLKAFEFVPTGTEVGIEINSAADFVKFAQDYNAGEYIGQEDLVVSLGQNITFDAESSAEFNATGGIGTKSGEFGTTVDNYFYGVFDGKGYTISGYTASVPLFKYTRSVTVIKNFTMDNSCSLTFTQPSGAEGDFGAVIGYHKGTVENVTVNANLSLAASEGIVQHTALGGIAGNLNNGSIGDCVYGGNITVPAEFSVGAGKKLMIGGIAGYVSNASGTIEDTDFEGTICNEGQVLDVSSQNNAYLIIGGIVGYGLGSIINCETKDNPTVNSAYSADGGASYLKGTIVNKTILAYACAVGGIIGENLTGASVSGCKNYATVVNTLFKKDDANNNGRRLRVGGIAGKNVGTISDSHNFAALTLRSTPFFQYLAGIAAWNTGGSISGCSNSGSLEIAEAGTGSNGPRYAFMGGVIGENDGTSVVSDIHNTSNLTVTSLENTGTVYLRMGGVIGSNLVSIDGRTGRDITNTGNLSVTNANTTKLSAPTSTNDYGLFLGGVVGWTSTAVANVINEGSIDYSCTAAGVGVQYVYLGGIAAKVNAASSVDINKCSNSGNLTFVPDATAPHSGGAVYNHCYLGGIAGYATNANIKGDSSTKCTNSGIVKGGEGVTNQNSTTPDHSFWVGGIVGYLTGSSSVSYCELSGSGQAYNNHWCNRGSSWKTDISSSMYGTPPPSCGGIVGQVAGASGSVIAISNCSVPSTATVWARRGACGGIVGIAQYASVSNCEAAVNIAQGYWNGGIIAAAKETSVSSCNFTGKSVGGSNESGGIVAYLDAGSSITSCNSYATTLTASALNGGIAGASVAGSSITGSHCKTGKAICSDSNYTDGNNNAADL